MTTVADALRDTRRASLVMALIALVGAGQPLMGAAILGYMRGVDGIGVIAFLVVAACVHAGCAVSLVAAEAVGSRSDEPDDVRAAVRWRAAGGALLTLSAALWMFQLASVGLAAAASLALAPFVADGAGVPP